MECLGVTTSRGLKHDNKITCVVCIPISKQNAQRVYPHRCRYKCLVKSRVREIGVSIALRFDGDFGSCVAEMAVQFQSDTIIIASDLAASGLNEILRQDVLRLVNRGPCYNCYLSLFRAETLKLCLVVYLEWQLILHCCVCDLAFSSTFYWHGLNLVPALISNYIHYKVRNEITSIHKLQLALRFRNGWVISFQTLLGMWLRIHVGIKVNPCY